VGKVEQGRKEMFKVATGRLRMFDLQQDPGEQENLAREGKRPSAVLRDWQQQLESALERADELPPPSLSDDDIAALKALGYID
jgi:hypothetical protein